MPPTFACPNPACTHVFPPEVVKSASSLVCPRCGQVFQFGPSQPPAARPGAAPKVPPVAPVARSVAPQAKAPPVAPRPAAAPPPRPPVPPVARVALPPVAVPVAVPVSPPPPPSALNFNSTPDLVVGRVRREATRRSKPGRGTWLAISALVLVGIGLAVLGWKWRAYFNRMDARDDDPVRAATLSNCRFLWPERPWKRDRDIEMKLHVNLGMVSSERNNCMGLYFKDYKTRLPGEAEMLDEALGKLRSYFQGLEWERRTEKVDLAGRPAALLEFQGEDAEHVQMRGECYLLAFRGYGYWFFTWGPLGDQELVSPEWDGLRERFSLLDGRKGWTEKPRDSDKVQGKKARYQLSYVRELWTPQPSVRDYDPLADLVLQGDEPDPDRKRSPRKTANLLVLVLPARKDLQAAAAAAREYVQQREEKDYPGTKMEVMKDKNGAELDRAAKLGGEPGWLKKFHVRNAEDFERFMVMAVVNRPEGVLVLVGDCLWERHDFWDQELTPLLDSLNFNVR